MLKLAQHELDDIARELGVLIDARIRSGNIYAEVGPDADEGDPADVKSCDAPADAALRDAIERIYEVCQTAHARELRKSSSAPQIPLDNDSGRA